MTAPASAAGVESMKCTRVEFAGYRRLMNANCSLDDRLIAFVGPNEAGKSTVLQGLAWLDAGATGR